VDEQELALAILEILETETDEEGELSAAGEQAVDELLDQLGEEEPAAITASAGQLSALHINAGAGSLQLQACCGEETESAALPRFRMLAYTGGPMRLPGFNLPVVVDLTGLQVQDQRRPVLLDHRTWKRLGHTESVVINTTNWTITAEGVVSETGKDAREVKASAANGFPWQSSIGANFRQEPGAMEVLRAGQRAEVNGRTITGPCYIARKAVLKEISFVPLGADDYATATIAAQGVAEMDITFEQWVVGFMTIEEFQGLSDEAKGALQKAYDFVMAGQKPEDLPPSPVEDVTPPPLPAGAKPPAIAATAGATDMAAAIAQQTADLIAKSRADLTAELNRQDSIRRICPDASLTTTITVNGKPQKVNLLQHAIKAGWTAQETELCVLRASRPAGLIGAVPAQTEENKYEALRAKLKAEREQKQPTGPSLAERLHMLPNGR
jgi:hypothetical protein